MSCLQVSTCCGAATARRRVSPPRLPALRAVALRRALLVLPATCRPMGLDQRPRTCPVAPVCAFGGKDGPKDDGDVSPWRSLEKAISNFKERSIENVLRQQMEQQQFSGDGGAGSPPDDDGPGDDSDYPEEDGFFDFIGDLLNTIIAFFGLIVLYFYFLDEARIYRTIKDYIRWKYFGGTMTRRMIKCWRIYSYHFRNLMLNIKGPKLGSLTLHDVLSERFKSTVWGPFLSKGRQSSEVQEA